MKFHKPPKPHIRMSAVIIELESNNAIRSPGKLRQELVFVILLGLMLCLLQKQVGVLCFK